MPIVSVNILTKNRKDLLRKALASVLKQTLKDFEIVVVNDGSTDGTSEMMLGYKDIKILQHKESWGITLSRQEALEASQGEYIAILDDDDEWIDLDKLAKQVNYLDEHKETVLVGGAIKVINHQSSIINHRPEDDQAIRNRMLLKNPFFTSTVMFRRAAAVKVGGFIKDEIDLGEDYGLWLRIGRLGKMYNFQQPFTLYSKPQYNKEKFKLFLKKQLNLIYQHRRNYPYYRLSKFLLNIRLWLLK